MKIKIVEIINALYKKVLVTHKQYSRIAFILSR